jgi:hypothetical protein
MRYRSGRLQPKDTAMTIRVRAWRLVVASIVTLALGAPALAEKGGHGKGGKPGKGASSSQGKGGGNAQGKSASKGKGPGKFESSHRSSIQSYYRDEYASSGNCPPGLAKKDNGCMPPGQARKWNVGSALPRDVHIAPLPPALVGTLSVPAPGYNYGYVDGEVILYGTSDRVVVDFVAVF